MKFLVCFLVAAVQAMAADPLLTVALFDFQSPGEAELRDLGPKMSTLLAVQLSADPRLIMVERTELDKVFGEQELSLSGTISPENAARVGHLTGAKVLITGRLIKDQKETIAVAKVIGTDTSRVFATRASLPSNGELGETARKLAKAIGDLAADNVASLTAPVEDPNARIARINQLLGPAGKRPAVFVSIPEQHFGRPVNDPAAETEIARILQACGFGLADAKGGIRADYAIEGEAFSERTLQRGNLISCKARVEVKLRDLSTGALLASDRQVDVATDLGELIAAKSALAAAGAQLAERLAGKLR